MRHDDRCESWPEYNPFDCPECKIFNKVESFTQEAVDRAYEDGRDAGRDEIGDEAEGMRDEIARAIRILENL